jgi:hypothetical protein
MAKRTGGQRRIRAISKRGKGENRVTMGLSRKKANASGYKAPKKRTGPNTAAKKSAAGRKSAMGGTGSTLKTKAKQKMLSAKGKSKALVRSAGKYKMTAAHRKAISDGLKKRSGNAASRIGKFVKRKYYNKVESFFKK